MLRLLVSRFSDASRWHPPNRLWTNLKTLARLSGHIGSSVIAIRTSDSDHHFEEAFPVSTGRVIVGVILHVGAGAAMPMPP